MVAAERRHLCDRVWIPAMDNLTHTLTGWVLGQTGLKRKTRKGLAALILGANMPDIDIFFGGVPWQPLATHRGFTHGFVGVSLMPPMLAGLLWLLDHWQTAHGAQFRSDLAMRFGWLVALSYIGALSHPLLDWQTAYAVQLLSPFSGLWFHNDALFIVDVWIWSGLALAIWLSRRRERKGAGWRKPAIVGLATLMIYIGGNGVLSERGKGLVRGADFRPDAIYASPPPLAFWRRELAWREGGTVAWANYDPLRDAHALAGRAGPVADNMREPAVRRALADPRIVSFARWSTMPMAGVEENRCSMRVSFGDARYGRALADNRFRQVVTFPRNERGC